jgi:hypothetical protein
MGSVVAATKEDVQALGDKVGNNDVPFMVENGGTC